MDEDVSKSFRTASVTK